MDANVCPDCKGTREYRGLNTVEPCATCCGAPAAVPVLPPAGINPLSVAAMHRDLLLMLNRDNAVDAAAYARACGEKVEAIVRLEMIAIGNPLVGTILRKWQKGEMSLQECLMDCIFQLNHQVERLNSRLLLTTAVRQ